MHSAWVPEVVTQYGRAGHVSCCGSARERSRLEAGRRCSVASPFQFGVSEFTTQPWSFEQDVETYKQLGVDTIEVCEFKLDDDRVAEQLALLGQHGLPITSVQPTTRTLFPSRSQPEPKEPRERMAQFRRTIERVSQATPGVPLVTNTGIPPN